MLKLTQHLLLIGLIGSLIAGCAPTPTTPAPTTAAPTVSAPTVSAPTPESAPASIATAEQLVDQFAQQDYAALLTSFNAAMKAALPEDKLKQAWTGITQQFGAFQGRTGSKFLARKDSYDVIVVTAQFEKSALGFRVSIDTTSGQIGGLQFVPAETAPAPYTVPAYVDQSKFEERDVTIGSGEWQLLGTLTLPKGAGPFPAVVLVHGSGPNDRDETVGPNRPFKDLAWGLASQGIAVLRYDKRTKVYGEQIAALTVFTVKEETVDDAALAVDVLRQQPNIDPQRVFVLGHSLGGYLAPRIAQANANLAGLIIVAGLTRPLEDTMLEQYQYIASVDKNAVPAEVLAALPAQVQAIKDLQPGDEGQPAILGAPAAYWLDLKDYRPTEVAKSVTKPMLILQGERDYQVTMVDFKNWQAALAGRSDVQFKAYADLNHLLISGRGQSTPQDYQQAGSVAAALVNDIAAWVKQH